jgi:hypothetical protein
MFIATNHPLKYSSLREERNVFPAGQGYKHLAPLGRNPTASTRGTSKLNSRFFNEKRKMMNGKSDFPHVSIVGSPGLLPPTAFFLSRLLSVAQAGPGSPRQALLVRRVWQDVVDSRQTRRVHGLCWWRIQ